MKYFTIEELCKSTKAKQHNIDNTPTEEVKNNLEELINNLLDPIREKWGGPITVNSGYRCKELNKLVGGAKTSDHLYGFAADITVGDKEKNKKLFNLICNSNLKWKQLIKEYGFSWIHISYDPNNLKQQVLSIS